MKTLFLILATVIFQLALAAADATPIPDFDSYSEGSASLFGFPPVKLNGDRITVWDREYALGKSGMVDSIRGRGRELTAGPIVLEGTIGDTPLPPKLAERTIAEATDDRVTVLSGGKVGSADFSVSTTVEYDGLIRYSIKITAPNPIEMKDVALRIPLPTVQAKYLHHIGDNSRSRSGTVLLPKADGLVWESKRTADFIPLLERRLFKVSDIKNSFLPSVWIGDMHGGVSFFAESDKDWSVNDSISFIEVVRTGNRTDLLVHFVIGAIRRSALALDFGLMATPVKPMPSSARQFKILQTVHPELYAPAFNNARWIVALDMEGGSSKQENRFARFPDNATALDAYVDQLRAKGFHYGAYICLDQISPFRRPGGASNFGGREEFIDKWVRKPFVEMARDKRLSDFYDAYEISGFNSRENLADILRYADLMLSKHGLELLYIDNNIFRNNLSPASDDCYRRRDGRLQPIYKIYQWRSFMRKLAALFIKYRGSTSGVYLHNTNVFFAPIMAFAGVTMPGELMGWHGTADQMDLFTEARGVVELSGSPWGVPSTLYADLKYEVYVNQCNKAGEQPLDRVSYLDTYTKAVLGAAFLHDASVFGMISQGTMTPFEKVKYGFVQGQNVQFFPYYGNQTISTDRDNVKVSSYLSPAGALIMVGNFSRVTENATLLFRTPFRFPMDKGRVIDALTGEVFEVVDGRLQILVAPHTMRMLRTDDLKKR